VTHEPPAAGVDPPRAHGLPYRPGVGAVLLNHSGLVFVGQRLDTAGEAWQMPQGGLDPGEDPRQAVLRELSEEIGTNRAEIIACASRPFRYDLPAELIGTVWRGRYGGQEQWWFALRFTGTDADIDLKAHKHPEFRAWRWVPMAELPRLAIGFKRQLYEDLVAEFSHLVSSVCHGSDRRERPS
jgi:putative (di)nucleoside polyphosphate hydrolase